MPETVAVESSLTEVVENLKREKQRISSELEAVRLEARKKENGLKRVNAALSALEGEPTRKGKKRKNNGKPSATKRQVEDIVKELVEGGMTIEAEDELQREVEKRLVEQGFSLAGLALRFRGVVRTFQSRHAATPIASSTESV